MGTLSPKDSELVVQNTEFEPIDRSDTRSTWQKFFDTIRTAIGLKPLHLAERWAEAKVRQEEAAAHATLLAARAQYELAVAEARRVKLEAEGQCEINTAVANYIRSRLLGADVSKLVETLLNSSSQTPQQSIVEFQKVREKIRLLGGSVELDLRDDEAAPQD